MAAESALRVESVSVSLGSSAVLTGVDLDVERGETVAVSGPSGAGKTTLLNVMCGLTRPDFGSVWIGGQRLDAGTDAQRAAARLRHFGLVFQEDALLPELTLIENVSLPLRLLRDGSASSWEERGRAELERLDIGELGRRLPAEVSGGQLQRAAVGRAVVHGPNVILADEPTSSLDETAARHAIQLLIQLAHERRVAVVVVTHDREVAASCSRRLMLREGRLVAIEAGVESNTTSVAGE